MTMMKKTLKFIIVIAITAAAIRFPFAMLNQKIDELHEKIEFVEWKVDVLDEFIGSITPDSLFNKEWFLFKLALIDVESGGNPRAVNPDTRAAGLFQIMPIYIREANRVGEAVMFTDSCKWDIERSNMMFETVNAFHNPEKDMYQAIRGHNPRAGDWYKERVMKRYQYYLSIAYQKH